MPQHGPVTPLPARGEQRRRPRTVELIGLWQLIEMLQYIELQRLGISRRLELEQKIFGPRAEYRDVESDLTSLGKRERTDGAIDSVRDAQASARDVAGCHHCQSEAAHMGACTVRRATANVQRTTCDRTVRSRVQGAGESEPVLSDWPRTPRVARGSNAVRRVHVRGGARILLLDVCGDTESVLPK